MAIILAAVYSLIFFLLDYLRFRTYDNGGDFGLFMQSVNDPSGLLRNSPEGSHFAAHFSPIYDLIMPFVHVSHSVIPMLVFQALAGGLVSFGIFELSRQLLPEHLAQRVAITALVYPALAGVIFGDPYENVFAPAASIWLMLFVYRRKWMLACTLAIIALSIKEDQAVFLAWGGVCGLMWAVQYRDTSMKRFSVFLIIASTATLLLFMLVIRPSFGQGGGWPALQNTLRSASEDTSGGFSLVGRLGYIAEMLVPLSFLPLFAPRLLIVALPALAEVLLARNSMVWTMGQHYAGVWIGPILVATAFGVQALYKTRPQLATRLVTAALVVSIADLTFASPTHWSHHVHVFTAHDRRLDTLLAKNIPRGTTLGTHDQLYAHLWNVPGIERGITASPRYALIDTTMTGTALATQMSNQIREMGPRKYRQIWDKDGVILYQRNQRQEDVMLHRDSARPICPLTIAPALAQTAHR